MTITAETLALYKVSESEMNEAQEIGVYCSRKWDRAEFSKPEIIDYIQRESSFICVAIIAAMGAVALMEDNGRPSDETAAAAARILMGMKSI